MRTPALCCKCAPRRASLPDYIVRLLAIICAAGYLWAGCAIYF